MFKVAELTTYILLMDNDDFVKNVSAVKVYLAKVIYNFSICFDLSVLCLLGIP